MAYLIQPITIDSVKRCFTCFGLRSTNVIITNNYIFGTNSADVSNNVCSGPWDVIRGAISNEGEFSFGVSCASSAVIEFSVAGSPFPTEGHDIECSAYTNGVAVGGPIYLSVGDVGEITVPLSPDICGTAGSIVTIICYDVTYAGTDVTVTAQINSIT